ncbi:MAG: helix-turn-helix domain-containing protein [Deltaproteobacteria bacterium]|jgi:DNA-binding XRE family transcriptional regulator|nr:helix-turn-helix domain-containing protein [Deltaproteobacteria bacterium]
MSFFKFENLVALRNRLLLSRAELARKAEMSILTIMKLENGLGCRPETARRLLKSLGLELNKYQDLPKRDIEEGIVFASPISDGGGKRLLLRLMPEEPVDKPKEKNRSSKTPNATKSEGKAVPKPKKSGA